MPLSWVPPLAISRERLDMRCPRGQKAVQYRQARREMFARYGECARFDGLVERLTTFDSASGATLCMLELFSRRKDRLVRRVAHPTKRSTLSMYEPGAPCNVKGVRVVRGSVLQRQTELTFYAENRADGLLRRVRTGSSLEEWFLPGGRPDGLVHRTVHYVVDPDSLTAAATQEPSRPGSFLAEGAKLSRNSRASTLSNLGERTGRTSMGTRPGSSAIGSSRVSSAAMGGGHRRRASAVVVGLEAQEQQVASIHEEFSHGHALPAPQQPGTAAAPAATAAEAPVAGAAASAECTAGAAAAEEPAVLERSFDLVTGQMEVVMQVASAAPAAAPAAGATEGAEVSRVTHIYTPEGDLMASTQEGAGQDRAAAAAAAALPPKQWQRGHAALMQACRTVQAAVLASEVESRDLLQAMQRQEQGDMLETGHYDVMRVKVEDSDSGEVVAEEEADTYDFLSHFLPHTGARDMTAAEAEAAQQACLAAFDDRQADRLRLLSARLAECRAEVARLQAIELPHLSAADQERVIAEEAAASFRAHVAQRRVEEHAPGVVVKRRELQARLAADPRIAAALGGE